MDGATISKTRTERKRENSEKELSRGNFWRKSRGFRIFVPRFVRIPFMAHFISLSRAFIFSTSSFDTATISQPTNTSEKRHTTVGINDTSIRNLQYARPWRLYQMARIISFSPSLFPILSLFLFPYLLFCFSLCVTESSPGINRL